MLDVLEVAVRGMRWKGESMETSSWRRSLAGRVKGIQVFQEYWDSSME